MTDRVVRFTVSKRTDGNTRMWVRKQSQLDLKSFRPQYEWPKPPVPEAIEIIVDGMGDWMPKREFMWRVACFEADKDRMHSQFVALTRIPNPNPERNEWLPFEPAYELWLAHIRLLL